MSKFRSLVKSCLFTVAFTGLFAVPAMAHQEPTSYELYNGYLDAYVTEDSDNRYFNNDIEVGVPGEFKFNDKQVAMANGHALWHGATYRVYSSDESVVVPTSGADCFECGDIVLLDEEGVSYKGIKPGTATIYLERTYGGVTKVVDQVEVRIKDEQSGFIFASNDYDQLTISSKYTKTLKDEMINGYKFYYDRTKEIGLGEQFIGNITNLSEYSEIKFEITGGASMYLGTSEDGKRNSLVYINASTPGVYNYKITDIHPEHGTRVLIESSITVKPVEYINELTFNLNPYGEVNDINGNTLYKLDNPSSFKDTIKYIDNNYNYYFNDPSVKYFNIHNKGLGMCVFDMFGNPIPTDSLGGNSISRELYKDNILVYDIAQNTGNTTVDVYRQLKTGGSVEKVNTINVTVLP